MPFIKRFAHAPWFSGVVGTLIMLTAFTLIDFSGWWSAQSLSNVVHLAAILGLMAMGQALVIITKEIDLSVGSVYGLTGIAFIMFQSSLGVIGAMIAALLLAAFCGFIQGVGVVKGGLPSMIVTLGGLFTFRGIIYVWTGGSVKVFPQEAREYWFTKLFGGELFGIEAAVFWLLIVLIGLRLTLRLTPLGNHLLATGGQAESAESRGVRTDKVKIITFMICSTLAGFAGILTLADNPQTHVTLGDMMELEAISAAVIGGCLLSGGRGSLIGAALGALIVVGFRSELIALGAPTSWFITFVGIVLIVAVIFNQKLARWVGHSV